MTCKPLRAARCGAVGRMNPYQTGGCGFCSGVKSIGTPSNWKVRAVEGQVGSVSPLMMSSSASA